MMLSTAGHTFCFAIDGVAQTYFFSHDLLFHIFFLVVAPLSFVLLAFTSPLCIRLWCSTVKRGKQNVRRRLRPSPASRLTVPEINESGRGRDVDRSVHENGT